MIKDSSAVIWQKGFNEIFDDFDIFAGKLLLWLELTLYEVVVRFWNLVRTIKRG